MFADRERELIKRTETLDEHEWGLRIWCAKEAVVKACGQSPIVALKDVSLRHLDIETGEVSLALSDNLAQEFPRLQNKRFQAHTMRDEDLILAVTIFSE
jgi:phosphopantetheinyl transferase (holo-ACP synthase)